MAAWCEWQQGANAYFLTPLVLPGVPQGVDLEDEELIEHISEATTMSKSLEEYEGGGGEGRRREGGEEGGGI